ncbi:MAG: hypothetical protein HY513_00050 [Candidatus Aenigmarchaeota archaeon]|nr:hypothetical protein [Candidatus Aenigmarchaeota archaeon]
MAIAETGYDILAPLDTRVPFHISYLKPPEKPGVLERLAYSLGIGKRKPYAMAMASRIRRKLETAAEERGTPVKFRGRMKILVVYRSDGKEMLGTVRHFAGLVHKGTVEFSRAGTLKELYPTEWAEIITGDETIQ